MSPRTISISVEIRRGSHVETIEALAKALNAFKGGVVVVSHDQFFISRVCKELWTIRNQTIVRFNGEFKEYKKLVSQGKIWIVCLPKIGGIL